MLRGILIVSTLLFYSRAMAPVSTVDVVFIVPPLLPVGGFPLFPLVELVVPILVSVLVVLAVLAVVEPDLPVLAILYEFSCYLNL
jgi:hypothetical protein